MLNKFRTWLYRFVLVAILFSLCFSALPLAVFAQAGSSHEVETNELLVKYAEGVSSIKELPVATKEIEKLEFIAPATQLVTLEEGANVKEISKKLAASRRVEQVEVNAERNLLGPVNDRYYAEEWWLERVQAPALWKLSAHQQRKLVVAVIDSGIDRNHVELSNRIAPGGYNFLDGTTDVTDQHGHGTNVAGVIAAEANNGIGISGITGGYDVAILPLKTVGKDGKGTVAMNVQAIDYAISRKVDVITISQGGTTPSVFEQEAIQRAIDAGIIIVASSGNEAEKGNPLTYPAAYDSVLSVGSIAQNNIRSAFSTYNRFVDVVAPGEKILTTAPANRLVYASGTSFSAPIVAGTIAMMKASLPDLTVQELTELVKKTATDLGAPGVDDEYGAGLLNHERLAIELNSLRTSRSAELGQVTGVELKRQADSLLVTWASVSNAHSYTVELAIGKGPFTVVPSSGYSAEIRPITPGETYHVRVRARSAIGEERVSDSLSYTEPVAGVEQPVSPPTSTVQPMDPMHQSIENQLNDKMLKDIRLETSSLSLPKLLMDKIVASKKTLTLSAERASLSIDGQLMAELLNKNPEQLNIAIERLKMPATVPSISTRQRVLSDYYSVTFTIQRNDRKETISTVESPLNLSFTIGAVMNAKKVAAFKLEANRWHYVGGHVKENQFTVKTRQLSNLAVLENAKTFTDVSGWSKEYIEVLASKNIIQGISNTTFGPTEEITRAQFAALLSRALNLPKKPYTGQFSDVQKGNWAALDIEAANRAGIVFGSSNGSFNPTDNINREQMAAMIIRAVESANPEVLAGLNKAVPFKDEAAISTFAKPYVGAAASLGIINGKPVNGGYDFSPKENATRAHAAKMLYQFLEVCEGLE